MPKHRRNYKLLFISFFVISISLVFLYGCVVSDENNYDLPDNCLAVKDDVCELYSCLVPSCWCDSGVTPSPILMEGTKTISNEQEAIDYVKEYLKSTNLSCDVTEAVKLNAFFYNVFTYDLDNTEKVFTVAEDGTIILTQCGV